MLLFDGRRQHDDLACAARRQRKASLRRAHAGQRSEAPREAARSRRASVRDAIYRRALPGMRAATSVSLGTSAGHASPSARASANNTGRVASETTVPASRTTWRHASTTSALDARSASTSSSRRGRSSPRAIRRAAGVFRTRDALSTSAVSAGISASRAARSARASAARAVFVCRRRIAIPATASSWAAFNGGREGRGVELGEHVLGLVEAADQEQAPALENPRMRGIHAVAMRFERRPRRVERLRRPAQVARNERDLGLGDDAPGAGHRLFRTEGARRTAQESLRSNEIAELRHRDAAQRKGRRVVTQADPLQCAERIARREARAAAVISESIEIPSHLSLPPFRCPALSVSHDSTVSRSEWIAEAKEPKR